MIRSLLSAAILLGGTSLALAQQQDASPANGDAKTAEIASCKEAGPQVTPLLQATEDYARKLGSLGPGTDTSIPSVLTGARRAALGNFYTSYAKAKADIDELQGDLQVLVAVANACAGGATDP